MKYFILIVCFFASLVTKSQTDKWCNYTNKLGIKFAFQDSNEINIISSGIRVVDSMGNTLREYNSCNSDFPTETITSGIVEENGAKWFGSPYGVGTFYQGNWQTFNTTNSGLMSNDVRAVTIDKDGNKWFGTYIGISKFDGVNWTSYNTLSTFGFGQPVKSLTVDSSNVLWVVYDNVVGAGKFDGNTWTFYNTAATGLTFSGLKKVIANPADGSVWFISNNDLVKRDGNNVWSKYTRGTFINDFDIDSLGIKWITHNDSLYKFNDTIWTAYAPPGGYINNFIHVFADDFGNKWLGYDISPFLIKFNNGTWTEIDYYGLSSNKVSEIEQDSAGNFWIASEAGLQKFDGTNWTTYNTSNSALLSNSVKCIEFDQQGNLWCAAYKTLYKISGNVWTTYPLTVIANTYVTDLAIDAAGNKWCSVYDGFVSKMNTAGQWINYYSTSGGGYVTPPGTTKVKCIEIDSQNKIWIGTDMGIAKYNGTNSTFYNTSNSALGGNNITALEIDHQGNIWAGYSGVQGISKFNGSSWVTYNSSNSTLGVNVTSVCGLMADPYDNIWIIPTAGYQGIYRFNGNITKSYSVPYFYPFLLQSPPFFDKNGRKWFVGSGICVLTDEQSDFVETDESLIIGKVFHDKNANGVKEATENYLQNMNIEVSPINATSFTSIYGEYKVVADTGNTYTINSPTQGFWYPTTPFVPSFVLHDSDYYVQDIGMNAIDTSVIVSNFSTISSRCNSVTPLWFTYENTGTLCDSGTIVLSIDSNVIISSSLPLYDSIVGQKVYYHFNSLDPGNSRQIRIDIQLPSFIFMGQQLAYTSEIITTDNEHFFDTLTRILTCAYDPNIKEVSPLGYRSPKFVLKNEELEYTLHFQNTGNDTALHVKIVDSLSQFLDWSSLNILASSHTVNTTLYSNGVTHFNFYNIMLPDSFTNESLSHGFVTYKIRCKSTIPEGAVVENTGNIFFDFNPAIVTNTTSNCMVSSFQTTTNVNASFCQGDSLYFHGTYYSTNETLIDTTLSVIGLDSIIVANITQLDLPIVSFTLNSNDSVCLNAMTVTLVDGMPAGGTYTGTGVSSDTFDPQIANIGWNIITYTYSDGNQCSNSKSDSIYVYSCAVGFEKYTEANSHYTIFPNPSNGIIHIESKIETSNSELTIYNVIGNKLLNQKIESKNITLDLSLFNSGVYFIEIKNLEGRYFERLVKK